MKDYSCLLILSVQLIVAEPFMISGILQTFVDRKIMHSYSVLTHFLKQRTYMPSKVIASIRIKSLRL